MYSMKFLSSEDVHYLCKCIIWLSMEFCCHAWPCAPDCYFDVLDKVQKQVCETVDPLLAASLKPLAHYRHVANLNLCYRYYFGRCSFDLTELVLLCYS